MNSGDASVSDVLPCLAAWPPPSDRGFRILGFEAPSESVYEIDHLCRSSGFRNDRLSPFTFCSSWRRASLLRFSPLFSNPLPSGSY